MLSHKGRVRRWTFGSRLSTGVIGGEHELHEMLPFFLLFSKRVLFFYGFCFFGFPFFLLSSFLFFLLEKEKIENWNPMKSGIGPPSPGTVDPNLALLTTLATNMEPSLTSTGSNIETLEPYESLNTNKAVISTTVGWQVKGKGETIYLDSIPLEENYEAIAHEFGKIGDIKEIRVRLASDKNAWETWITYHNQEDALKACQEVQANSKNIRCCLVEKPPGKLDIYKPSERRETNLISPGSP